MGKRILPVLAGLFLTVLLAGTALGEFSEDIIGFNPRNAQVVNAYGSWKIAADNIWLLDFGPNQAQADQALRVIHHYRLNQQCFVGRPAPSMQYYLCNGRSPAGPMSGEDSIRFDNSNLRVVNYNGRWKIVEGTSHAMLDFGSNEEETWTALRIIWKYEFNYICFVGRPHAPMMYFRR